MQAPPEHQDAPGQRGAGKDWVERRCGGDSVSDRHVQPGCLTSDTDLEQLTRELEIIAHWKAELKSNVRRAELLQDTGLLSAEQLGALTERADLFKQCCAALMESISGKAES